MKKEKKIDELQAEIEDPNQQEILRPDPFKKGSKQQKGFMETPLEEQQYESEPDPPHQDD